MSTESLSVLVAALAVIVSAVMQFLTLRGSRQNEVSTLRAGASAARLEALRTSLAEYMNLTYHMDLEWGQFQVMEKPLSAQYYEWADREDQLYNLIRLYLDEDDPDHRALLESVHYLRDYNPDDSWIDRRDRLVKTARAVFAAEEREALAA